MFKQKLVYGEKIEEINKLLEKEWFIANVYKINESTAFLLSKTTKEKTKKKASKK